jgi:PAS domain-containing protein
MEKMTEKNKGKKAEKTKPNMEKEIIKRHPNWNRYILVLSLIWTVTIFILMGWNLTQINLYTLETARIQARSTYEKDIIYRSWNASHGGVYVPVTEKTQPNLYLVDIEEREIITPSGRLLTLINPAYMTRQVHELGGDKRGVRGHITSLNPIRPENAADDWETKALQAFELGETEFSSIEEFDGEIFMRLMRPLITEENCLKCHAAQGYKIGDVRGGISVDVPMESLMAIEHSQNISIVGGYGLLWLLGIIGINFSRQRLISSERIRLQAMEALRDSEEKYRVLYENAPLSYQSLDEDGRFLDVNPAWLSVMRHTPLDKNSYF